ncbi:MAG: MBL fold metallo-hydrolase [Bacillota bacterium]
MRLERVSEHIWSLTVWVLIPVRVWLVRDPEGGVTLVDAGLPFTARGILRAVERLHAGPLQRILLTHGHSDHVGALRRIVTQTPVPVYAHAIEIPYLEGALPYPRRKRPQALVPKGLVTPLEEGPDGGLRRVAGLKPYLTPGHAPGHVVYYHEQDQVLIGGDLAMSKKGQVRPPMAIFTGDMEEAIRSLQILRELEIQRLELCHADPVERPAERMEALLRDQRPRLWPKPGA